MKNEQTTKNGQTQSKKFLAWQERAKKYVVPDLNTSFNKL